MLNRLIFSLFFIGTTLVATDARGQKSLITLDVYLELVKTQSPLALQAELAPRRAAEQQRMARGGFDPTLYSYFDDKVFKQKEYFSLSTSGLKIPLPIGEAKIGYEVNSGSFLNPDATTPSAGLGMLGVSIPLLQGLLTDERRVAVKQANVGVDIARNDQKQTLTDLLFEAQKAYWDWVQQAEQQQTINETYQLAKERLVAIKQSVTNGDRAAIDTLEQTLITRQWLIEVTSASLRTRASELYAMQFLGNRTNPTNTLQRSPISFKTAEKLPYAFKQFSSAKKVDSLRTLALNATYDNTLIGLQTYQLKQQNLRLEQKLKEEKLKPKLNINYNALAEQFNYSETKYGDFSQNYKLGVQFSYPIFTRTERGSLAITKLKQDETTFAQDQKRIELQTKIDLYFNELQTNLTQIELYEQQQNDYTRLRDAEVIKYQLGDSNIFMVNSRDTKLLEAGIKLAELKAKHFKYWATLTWLTTTF